MRHSDRAIEIGAWMLENGHRAALKLTGGRWPRRVLGMQAVELHTIGRKSGLPRSTMLATPVFDDDRIVLVASKGGHTNDPDWYRNIVANPEVELTMDNITRPMIARTASPEEKSDLWPEITRAYKGYASYKRNTDRDIPVIILEYVPDAD